MLSALVLALARPAHAAMVPDNHALVIIAIDASLSMEATDLPPSRLRGARDEAGRIVAALPARVRVGIVAFSEEAVLEVTPTANRTAVFDAINAIRTSAGTAVGEAIFASLDAIRHADDHRPGSGSAKRGPSHSAIVLISDGETTLGRSTTAAVAAAKAASIPITTIAVGTRRGSVRVDGVQFNVPVQQKVLHQIAENPGGHHYDITSPTELQLDDAYAQLGSDVAYRSTPSELTGWFLVGALGAGGLAAAGSLAWGARVP
jgi:Ca-activated chloride channel family protein